MGIRVIKLLCQGVLGALMVADTPSALALLNDSQGALLDPLEGPALHAELLYYSIKHANKDVIMHLVGLCIPSDVSFFNYCGFTPAGLAMEEGLDEMVPLILEKTDKQFALYTAVQLKNVKLRDLLLKTCVFKDRLLRYLGLATA